MCFTEELRKLIQGQLELIIVNRDAVIKESNSMHNSIIFYNTSVSSKLQIIFVKPMFVFDS